MNSFFFGEGEGGGGGGGLGLRVYPNYVEFVALGLRVDGTHRLASARKGKIGQHQEARLSGTLKADAY